MNNRTLNTIIYILIAFLIIGIVLKVLPYIILGGIIAYISFKVYTFFKGKALNKQNSTSNYNEASTYETSYKSDDVDTSEAIDVDFKEVK